jgi:hypothetical protein
METKAATILECIRGLRGSLSVTFEEGTSAAWLPRNSSASLRASIRSFLLPSFNSGLHPRKNGVIRLQLFRIYGPARVEMGVSEGHTQIIDVPEEDQRAAFAFPARRSRPFLAGDDYRQPSTFGTDQTKLDPRQNPSIFVLDTSVSGLQGFSHSFSDSLPGAAFQLVTINSEFPT